MIKVNNLRMIFEIIIVIVWIMRLIVINEEIVERIVRVIMGVGVVFIPVRPVVFC